MSTQKLVTVYGATGAQGRSVVRSLLRDQSGIFQVRAISRNPDSESARALATAGAEVVKADGFRKEELVNAFAGSWGVFVNTNSDDPAVGQKNGPSETDIGKDVIDAAVKAGVKYFVYSGLASASNVTNGEVPIECFDEKHAIAEYARSKPSLSSVVVISPGWYMENFLDKEIATIFGGLPYFPDEDGYLTLHWPHWGGNDEAPLAAIGADFGDYAHGVFLQPEKYNGMFIHGFSQPRSLSGIAQDVQEVTGKKARFVPIKDWRSIETHNDRFMVTVKGMFGLCQYSDGCYYGTPNSTQVAYELKQAAITAQGGEGDGAKLFTFKEFLQDNLPL